MRPKIADIDVLEPNFLWLALGVSHGHAFVEECVPLLPHVGHIETSGGLSDFLSGSRARAFS